MITVKDEKTSKKASWPLPWSDEGENKFLIIKSLRIEWNIVIFESPLNIMTDCKYNLFKINFSSSFGRGCMSAEL